MTNSAKTGENRAGEKTRCLRKSLSVPSAKIIAESADFFERISPRLDRSVASLAAQGEAVSRPTR